MPRHLPPTSRWLSHHTSRTADPRDGEGGFSFMEILVGMMILTSALGMAVAMNGMATRSLSSSTVLNDRNAAVDADIAMVRSMAERYTWCSGAPSLEASDPTTCLGSSPSDESYFSPAVSQQNALDFGDFGNNNKANFERACEDGTLSDDLIQRINNRPNPAGITRSAAGITSAGRTHRIQIIYQTARNDDNPVVRSVVITPPVASFCP